ncbi:MAG: hypothetical protein RL367_258 [Pseudomonadota bacterium]|jgi:hypothetical protein
MTIKSALFVDFDNVFITLQNDSPGLANRFAARPLTWLRALETSLKTPHGEGGGRRIISQRCYASPHAINHYRLPFTQAGLEVIDCPPLTSRMKNSADIYIVMDVLDYLVRYPHIDEFIILSADADFVPVLNRLRKEMKLSAIFTSFDTASSYRNVCDLTISADFFRDTLELANAPARPSASVEAVREIVKRPDDFWQRVEACLVKSATAKLGRLAFETGAHDLKANLFDLVGTNWAGYGRFSEMMDDAKFLTLQWDRPANEFFIPDFKLDLADWGDSASQDMIDFVDDVLHLQEKRIPFYAPDHYTIVFDCLATAFRATPTVFNDAILAATALCESKGVGISAQEMRFVATGVRLQGLTYDEETDANDIARAWRLNVWGLCGEPDWMREDSEATYLATWFHGPGETIADGAFDFVDRTSDDQSPPGPADEAA